MAGFPLSTLPHNCIPYESTAKQLYLLLVICPTTVYIVIFTQINQNLNKQITKLSCQMLPSCLWYISSLQGLLATNAAILKSESLATLVMSQDLDTTSVGLTYLMPYGVDQLNHTY